MDALRDDITVICAIAVVVGLIGTIVPVLPGGGLVAGAVGVWALVVQTAGGWVTFAAVVLLVVAGAILKYLTAGRVMTSSTVPTVSFLAAGVLGIVGFFVIPVVGLLVGFLLGLFGAEYHRLRDPRAAWASSWLALKGVGLGMLVEMAAALLAAGVWGVAVWRGAAG